MKLSRLGEFGLIERVRRATPKSRDVLLGIGDDAAWITSKARSCLITSDILIEGVHFDLQWTTLFDLGYKTLAVNLSDIAAMGGVPAYLILSLGIPANFDSADIDEFYRGIRSLAVKSGVALVGGDTSVAELLFISACVVGYAPFRPVTRGGAKPGDDIYVTGSLGDSGLALSLLQDKSRQAKKEPLAYLLKRHHQPTPRLSAGALLARERLATAMIDVSDGLLQDLGHICKASGVGAVVWEDKLPLSRAYRMLAGRDGTRHAFSGGEDYELLFCARPRDRSRIEKSPQRAGVAITRIGTCVTRSQGIVVLASSGKRLSIRAQGHDHFKSSTPILKGQ
ncbi:MAG TPA: thiamine-phosphate kinase [Methylomirabilota bacterium]|nr:thiamine-phosphate kinase [Methylomirabilota bacterium]